MVAINLRLTEDQYRLLVTHKVLLEADTWDEYVNKILQFPMQQLNYGEDPYTMVGWTKMVTVRLSKETYERANELRNRLNRTWRHMILEPSNRDSVHESIQYFRDQSTLVDSTEDVFSGQEP